MSGTSIHGTTVGGFKGLVLENEVLRIVVLPDFGARIISLIYKPTETEFAWHNPKIPIKKPNYEIEFEDISGFFDCVPTTEACTFKGKKLPAMGEVASEKWGLIEREKQRNSVNVTMECACRLFPLTIRKRISISKHKPVLHLRYALRNLSDEDVDYHYSAHNTLCVSLYHRIAIPREVSKLKLGPAATDRLGKLGDEVSWPQAVDKDGVAVALDKLPNPSARVAENLFTPRLRETWCASLNEARREVIGFSWSNNALPYLLLWINGGGAGDYYHMALEPMTGRPDNLETAVNQWKECAILRPRETRKWDEWITLAHGVKHVERIEQGNIKQ